jgi:hypothetical protein
VPVVVVDTEDDETVVEVTGEDEMVAEVTGEDEMVVEVTGSGTLVTAGTVFVAVALACVMAGGVLLDFKTRDISTRLVEVEKEKRISPAQRRPECFLNCSYWQARLPRCLR